MASNPVPDGGGVTWMYEGPAGALASAQLAEAYLLGQKVAPVIVTGEFAEAKAAQDRLERVAGVKLLGKAVSAASEAFNVRAEDPVFALRQHAVAAERAALGGALQRYRQQKALQALQSAQGAPGPSEGPGAIQPQGGSERAHRHHHHHRHHRRDDRSFEIDETDRRSSREHEGRRQSSERDHRPGHGSRHRSRDDSVDANETHGDRYYEGNESHRGDRYYEGNVHRGSSRVASPREQLRRRHSRSRSRSRNVGERGVSERGLGSVARLRDMSNSVSTEKYQSAGPDSVSVDVGPLHSRQSAREAVPPAALIGTAGARYGLQHPKGHAPGSNQANAASSSSSERLIGPSEAMIASRTATLAAAKLRSMGPALITADASRSDASAAAVATTREDRLEAMRCAAAQADALRASRAATAKALGEAEAAASHERLLRTGGGGGDIFMATTAASLVAGGGQSILDGVRAANRVKHFGPSRGDNDS